MEINFNIMEIYSNVENWLQSRIWHLQKKKEILSLHKLFDLDLTFL